jgi:hypothetical protein
MSTTHQFFAAAFSLAFVAGAARAQSGAAGHGTVSALPIASVDGDSARLSGAVFVVKGAAAKERATVYTLEGISNGACIDVEIDGTSAQHARIAAGAVVTAKMTRTGTVLAAGNEAIALIPHA